MHTETVSRWKHEHVFEQDKIKEGEKRTLLVVIITAAMMVVEVLVGIYYGSMALLADGIHMGSHMAGLLIALIAYWYTRKFAKDDRFSFGTGKVNSFAGYTSAVFLIFFAFLMGYESVARLINPVEIHYNIAITVTIIGLVVNAVSMVILGERGHELSHAGTGEDHDHSHDHHSHDHHDHEDHDHHDHTVEEHHDHGTTTPPIGSDHNRRAAYLHVLADALTSLLAIFALLAAKYFGWDWADPVVGIVGAIMVARWSISLIKNTSKVLLDHQGPEDLRGKIAGIVESYKDTKVTDLHLWSIGPGISSASMSVVTKYPESPDKYKTLIPENSGVVHAVVEVYPCEDE